MGGKRDARRTAFRLVAGSTSLLQQWPHLTMKTDSIGSVQRRNNPEKSNDSLHLGMLNSFFSTYLYGDTFRIEAIEKRSFEKQNSRNSYLATPFKLTTNTMNALGLAITEDAVRKRLRDTGPTDISLFKSLNLISFEPY